MYIYIYTKMRQNRLLFYAAHMVICIYIYIYIYISQCYIRKTDDPQVYIENIYIYIYQTDITHVFNLGYKNLTRFIYI